MLSTIKDFLENDEAKLNQLILDYPINLSTKSIAEFLGMDIASVRATIESGVLGCSWKKSGKDVRGYFIPTAQFVRWYMKS